MELVHGRTSDQIDPSTQEAITLGAAVVHAVSRTQMESSKSSGPSGGGRGFGFPWGDERLDVELQDAADLLACIDRRL